MSALAVLADAEFWARLVGIVIIDLTLAGDNALVIALAVRSLPARERFWGRIWGTAGAVVLRLFFIGVASLVLTIPLVQLGGGLLLVWIAVKLVRQEASHEGAVRHGTSLREAIWIIVVADAAMSLDNVIAVAATAHGDLVLVTFGIGLSLPLVVWGSGLLARLMDRFPAVIWLGGGILGYVAGEMVFRDPAVAARVGALGDAAKLVSVALAVAIGALGWQLNRAARLRTASQAERDPAPPRSTSPSPRSAR
jgi:YjbE family integral membrane protein